MSDEPGVPKLPLILLAVGTPLGVALLILGQGRVGLPISVPVALAMVIVAINLGIVTYGPYRLRHPREPNRTGRTLAPDPKYLAETASDCRWVGAGRLRGSLGLVNASKPLVVLTVTGSWLELRVRPSFLSTFFGARPLRVEPSSCAEVFPARGWFGTTWLGIRDDRGGEGYFATNDVSALLTLLGHRGFPVSWEIRKIPPL